MPNRQAVALSGLISELLIGIGLFLILGMAACSQVSPAHIDTASPQVSTSPTLELQSQPSSISATSTPIILATSTPDKAPTPVCIPQQGNVEDESLETSYMYEPFKFRVYLPPCYTQELDRQYPVLYLFHGLFFSDDQWTRMGVAEVVDRLIISGEVDPFIIIMPYDPNQREPESTKFDEVFMKDLLPYIEANYRILSGARNRAIGGLSRGAGWAIHFGLNYPDLFGAIGAHSPIIFWEDSSEIGKWLDSIPRSRVPRFYVDIGDKDPNPDSAILLDSLLTDRKILHEFLVNPGFHTEQYWESQVENYMRWYAAEW